MQTGGHFILSITGRSESSGKYMFEYPLIRFDNKQWLELFQKGSFFARTFLYYQNLETDDVVRSDVYDGSIPFPDKNGVIEAITGRKTSNQKLVIMNRFIKSFFRCNESNFSFTPSGLLKLSFSKETKEEIRKFGTDSAMIIASPSELIKQVKFAADAKGERIWYGDVKYLNVQGYNEIIKSLFERSFDPNNIPFLKRIEFSLQQEYRICIERGFDSINDEMLWTEIDKGTVDQTYTIEVGPLKNTCIVSINNLIEHGLLIDTEGHFYICEE